MKKFLFSLILFTIYYLIFNISFALADLSSQPIYGGGQASVTTGNIVIDKKVLNPQTNKLVDSLGINDPKYQPGNTINFEISLTNTGNAQINHIDAKDVFPQFLNFSNGPGNFDTNTKTLSFEFNNLKPNETKTFAVVGKIVEGNQLPIDLGVVCMVNQATAITSDNGTSQDNTQFCIQKEVLGTQVTSQKGGFPVLPAPTITTTPATGPEGLVLFSLLPTGIAGWLLRKYSNKK